MRAQYWSLDAIFGMTVFLAGIIILLSVWYNVVQEFSLSYGYGAGGLQDQLVGLQNRIVFAGVPGSWNTQVTTTNTMTWNNISIGLGTGDNTTVSVAKILELAAMTKNNYQATKAPLGIGYEYYIVLSSQYFSNVSIGLNPATYNATSIQVASRQVALDNGLPANIKMMIWTNRTYGVS
ncbi:MAG: hypothetical protein KGI00_05195 [Candidatus Micrarchaeota archaeon]|nr:hypothetical protein [Candidatus Micrarchaeota archaeon]MDE1824595.1 hypothetical protein [Candidatus Micrarchaeota archaeon]MDE1850094.1 hypothetical protein [Candidatus Micrarchaeota archaeon]